MGIPRGRQRVEHALPAHLYLVGRVARPRLFVLDRRAPCLEYEVGQLNSSQGPVPGDFYYWGRGGGRLAVLAWPARFFSSHRL